MTDAKVSMQFGGAHFSAEGTEQYVSTMLDRWIQLAQSGEIVTHNAPSVGNQQNQTNLNPTGGSANDFENVFDQVDGALKIIAHIPGTNKAAKTRNMALVLLFGRHLNGEATTSADEIRDACLDQGCYDSSNFASHLKGLKEKVAMNTKAGGGYDVKLTAPGRKAARELVEQLNNELA